MTLFHCCCDYWVSVSDHHGRCIFSSVLVIETSGSLQKSGYISILGWRSRFPSVEAEIVNRLLDSSLI